ncbi:hypothetical protein J3Q64DRAFT_1634637 [Phycomyces blakesleeanus]|uniref:Uncharacterized protein n=1 Tax=Phycomyces blakesleeanus TaxID=4837 RepID=A0ABR3B7N1_PHYBL
MQPSLDPLNFQNLQINSRYQASAPAPIQQSNQYIPSRPRQHYSTFSTASQVSVPLVLPLGPSGQISLNRPNLDTAKPPLYSSAYVQQTPTGIQKSPTKRFLHPQLPHPNYGTTETSRDVLLMRTPPTVQDLHISRLSPQPPPNNLLLIVSTYIYIYKINIPLINNSSVIRCTKCRSYINPFIQFAEGGTKWQCNLCDTKNQVPPFFDWDSINQRPVDRWSRVELNHGCVDIVAPSEYAQDPLQPPVYVFIIDVSVQAVQAGILPVVANSILEALDSIPNPEGRVKVTFLTVDSGVGFYSLSGKQPELMVVSDLSEIYLPRTPDDLVVNLLECRPIVEDLLKRMSEMHVKRCTNLNCLGVAIEAAKQLLDFYRSISSDCCKANISVDMFVFGSNSVDLATMNMLPRFTGGHTHYFPGFNGANGAEANKLRQEILCMLNQDIGLEGVMRTRCSSGIACTSFHGNITPLSSDVMLLPNVPQGQSFCVEMSIEAEICTSTSFFQTALIYTTSSGERRIRVMTLCLPVTKTIEKAVTQKRRHGRDHLVKETAEICKAYNKEMTGAKQNGENNISICHNLSLLPLLIFGILKSETFNEVNIVPWNICTQTTLLLRTLPLQEWARIVHPNLYSLHNLPPLDGIQNHTMPLPMNLSLEKFDSHGCYLLENGQRIMIWIGRNAVPQLCKDLLNVSDIHQINTGQVDCLPKIDNPLSQRVNSIIEHIRSRKNSHTYYPSIYIIREDAESPLRSLFLSHLVESTGSSHATEKKNIISNLNYLSWLHHISNSSY